MCILKSKKYGVRRLTSLGHATLYTCVLWNESFILKVKGVLYGVGGGGGL
jgi:hypothetical protein